MPFQQAALKGHNIPARGNALGIGPPVEEALKGRNIELLKFCASQSKPKICNALSGLKTLWHHIPRALTWAGMFNPCGARNKNRSPSLANFRTDKL